MAFSPVAYIIPQYDKAKFKNYWLKAYLQGTTTPISISIDAAGTTTLSRAELNADGFPITAGGDLFIPHIDGTYDLWAFPTAAEADANDTTNAVQFADNINSNPANAADITLSGATESYSLASGQTSQAFSSSLINGALYVSGPDVDDARLVPTTDYTLDLIANSVTLTKSYPAGTLLILLYNDIVSDQSVIAPLIFNTVALMQTSSPSENSILITAGRTSVNDGEGAIYVVRTVADVGAADGINDFSLANGLVAKQNGLSFAEVNIGDRDVPPGANKLFVRDVIADATDTATTVQIQRQANYSASTNPKALRVLSTIASGVDSVEYAISGELTNNSNSVNGGAAALSGVSVKNAQGNTFGGHFQVKDTTGDISSIAGTIVGQELNIQANGADDSNVRIGYDVIARTYEPNFATDGAGEFYCGIRIRNSSLGAEGGKWNNAIIITDGTQTIPNGIVMDHTPGTGVGVGLKDSGSKARGIQLDGQYGTAAIDCNGANLTTSDTLIRLKDRGKIEFDTGVSLKWDSTVNGGSGSMVLLGQNTQLTVGAAGAGAALPATPSGYLNLNLNGSDFVMPFYAKS